MKNESRIERQKLLLEFAFDFCTREFSVASDEAFEIDKKFPAPVPLSVNEDGSINVDDIISSRIEMDLYMDSFFGIAHRIINHSIKDVNETIAILEKQSLYDNHLLLKCLIEDGPLNRNFSSLLLAVDQVRYLCLDILSNSDESDSQ